jgi:hypothetical protein
MVLSYELGKKTGPHSPGKRRLGRLGQFGWNRFLDRLEGQGVLQEGRRGSCDKSKDRLLKARSRANVAGNILVK